MATRKQRQLMRSHRSEELGRGVSVQLYISPMRGELRAYVTASKVPYDPTQRIPLTVNHSTTTQEVMEHVLPVMKDLLEGVISELIGRVIPR